jgi:hypothetical protein
VLVASGAARADRFYVGPPSGRWNNFFKWSTTQAGAPSGGTPGTTTGNTFIIDSDTTSRNITLDTSTNLNALTISNTSLGSDRLIQTTGSFGLSAISESLGAGTFGHGVHTQSVGINAISGLLSVGDGTGGFGNYNISGNAALSTGSLIVGNIAAGTFNQSGGTVTVHVSLGTCRRPSCRASRCSR